MIDVTQWGRGEKKPTEVEKLRADNERLRAEVDSLNITYGVHELSEAEEAADTEFTKLRTENMRLRGELEAARKALAPVLDWYQSDESEPRTLAEILTDLVDDLQSDRADALELAVKKALLGKIPKKEDVELAIRANNAGGLEFRQELCQCDPDVGMSPCMYCAIDNLLSRVLTAAEAVATAEKARETC